MHIEKPKLQNVWNINTLIAVAGFGITIGLMLWTGGQSEERSRASLEALTVKVDTWIGNHEQMHKDRLAVVSAIDARTDQRISALEASNRKMENLEYRLTVQEQGSANLARSVEELKTTVNSLGTDIRVIREIVTRLDPRTEQ